MSPQIQLVHQEALGEVGICESSHTPFFKLQNKINKANMEKKEEIIVIFRAHRVPSLYPYQPRVLSVSALRLRVLSHQ